MKIMMQLRAYLQKRRMKKTLRRLLKDSRHVRNMRGDIVAQVSLERLSAAELAACNALSDPEYDFRRMESAAGNLAENIRALCPVKPQPALRENIEVLVVAIAVAMAFRTYFIQPFKIPTSSMHPTLHGIEYSEPAGDKPGAFDRLPLKLGKWLFFGEWYVELKARNTGVVRFARNDREYYIMVGETPHKFNINMKPFVSQGQTVYAGQRLAAGIRTAGDHIFVNRLVWNLRRPRRGEIMVFKTTGIEHSQIKKNEHYVKRMVGLPGEKLFINPPRILVNDRPVDNPAKMREIQSETNGYAGYLDIGDFLSQRNGVVHLGTNDYFACGDNQHNSLDSRYWGPVKRRYLVGPTFFVYWPLSRRWGWAY